jgi:hypothetical protein
VGTQRGIVVSEGGPRASKVFVNDDPRLCPAVGWWRELARASGMLLVPLLALGALAARLAGVSEARYAIWIVAFAAGSVCARLAVIAPVRRRVVYRETAPGVEVVPAQQLPLARFAGVIFSRMWPAFAMVAAFENAHGGSRLLVALAWAPGLTAIWTAASSAYIVLATARWEQARGLRLLFAAGTRQRAAERFVLYTTPR